MPTAFDKAVIVNPPNPPGYVSNKDSMGGFGQLYPPGAPPFPPLDIAYLAGTFSHADFDVTVLEAGALQLDCAAACARLRATGALERTLVFVRTSLPTIDVDLAFCAQVKALAPAAIVLFGPPAPALRSRIEQDTSIDFAILTEADGPATGLMRGTPPLEIPGLLCRTASGWTVTPERPFEKNLDSLPFPRWDLLPVERYVIPKSSASGNARFLPMLTSRGCPFGCSYCPYPVGQGLKWRWRSPTNVVDEMQHLVERHGVEHILFRDPMFSAQKKRVQGICEEILRRGLKVGWKCETRVDCLDEPTIEIMARAGCTGVNFGVESTDPEIQKGVHRQPIMVEDFVRTVEQCRRHGIATFAFFVIGLPGDTVDTILGSIAFSARIRADWTQFTVATPFIGTPLFDWAVREGFVAPDFYRIVSAHEGSVGNENLRPEDITRLHRAARFLGDHLLNRHGILKNRRRRNPAYVAAKAVADGATMLAARAWIALIGPWFRATIEPLPARPRVHLERSEPVGTSRATGPRRTAA